MQIYRMPQGERKKWYSEKRKKVVYEKTGKKKKKKKREKNKTEKEMYTQQNPNQARQIHVAERKGSWA